MAWGKQLSRFTLHPDFDCELCGEKRWGFRCNICGQTVCIDCDCKCDVEVGS
jgi:hypothetical protein